MAEILFDRYEVAAVLSSTDEATSYQVKAPGGGLAFLKTVTANPRETQEALEGLKKATRVSHPNLAKITAVEATDQGYYYVREWVEGTPFEPDASGPLRPDEARRIVAEACLGVGALHRAGTMHGNIHPSNLIEQSDGAVIVVDAGLPPRRSFPAQDSAFLARYATPEQIQGMHLSPQSDVYLLGLILYELLTGRPGFSGPDAATVADAHRTQYLPSPSSSRPSLPEDLDRVVARATAKAPSGRYADASSLGDALSSPGEGRSWKWVAVAGIGVLVVLAAILIFALMGGEETVTAPDLSGLTLEQAGAQLESAGLKLGDVGERDTAEVEPGAVLAQSPEAGADVGLGSTVDVTVATLPQVEVPDLSGASETEAVARLGQAGLRLREIIREPSDEVQAGHIISQDPQAGTIVALGSEVTLAVSRGPEPPAAPDAAIVPNVIGLQEETAIQTLESAGFSTRSRTVESDQPAGAVVSQEPVAGTRVEPGVRVSIQMSAGPPEQVTVPDVMGRDILDARSTIRGAGLRVDYQFVQEGAPYLKIIAQDPAPGTNLPEGSEVSVTLSLPSLEDILG